ncbi:nitroreductase family protein [Lysinibacter cavernae]|uniref:Putative NAD(P)H nitroreductase n=1 Tax=Lysinibacter cavernae TaxID=1640652 RepID=A0A7X5R1S0_9MICO|nr:nitroreductase [Lysinibacter cavernae]
MSELYNAIRNRRSFSKVTEATPDSAELEHLLEAAGRVADHSSLHPWRVIAIRGESRTKVGKSLAKADGKKKGEADGFIRKAHRAELLLAVVFSPKPSHKVPSWEQEAVASGVAHSLSLLLDDAGWGVLWRTGPHTRAKPVAKAHKLRKGEKLMGWLYVGGKPDGDRSARKTIAAADYLSEL